MTTVTEERYSRCALALYIQVLLSWVFGYVGLIAFPDPASVFGVVTFIVLYTHSMANFDRGIWHTVWLKLGWIEDDWVLTDVDKEELAENGPVEV